MSVRLPPIDDDIYEHLKSHAMPLEDDINSVLRRLLGVPPQEHSKEPSKTPTPKGSILPEDQYELPILRALHESGGRRPTAEAIDRVGDLLAEKLTPADHEKLASGETRWRNRAQFVRLTLVKKGDMKADSPRGTWELSEQGKRRLAATY